MQKQFQSKSVPRGTRTIWRYLSALFLIFTLGIGQMWAACEKGALLFSMEVTSNPASKIQVAAKSGGVNGSLDLAANANVTVIGTSAVMYNSNSSAYDAITTAGELCFKNSSKHWIEISFSCELAAGDQISFTTTKTNPIAFSGTASGTKYSTTNNRLEISTTGTSELIGKKSLWIWRPGNEPNIKSLRIIRPVTITLDAATNGGTTSVASVKGATGDKVVLPHAFKSGYKFKGWYTAETDGTKRADYYNISGDEKVFAQFEALPVSGEMFSLEMQESLKPTTEVSLDKGWQVDLLQYASISGGAALACNTTSSSNHMKITTDGKLSFAGTCAYLKIDLDFDLAKDDTIKIDATNKLWISATATSAAPSTGPYINATNQSYVVKDDDGLKDNSTIYIWRSSNAKATTITITRPAPAATYTVTFDNNGHGGTAPDAQSGITSGGKATEPTKPEDASYNFDGWYNMEDWTDPSAEKWNFGTSTVTKDTTLYAKWTDKSVKSDDATLSALTIDDYSLNETFASATENYTVTLPFYASAPATSAVHATMNDPKASVGDVTYDSMNKKYSVTVTAENTTTTKTYTISLNWAATPTASSSINIEQLVLDHGKKYDIAAAFAAAHIAYDKKGNTDELDSLKNQSGRNEPYLGLKMKKTDASITVVVPASSTLKVKFGNLPSAGIKVTINGVAQANHTSGNFELAATSAIREVVLAAPSTSTIVFKQIMVGEDIQSVQLPWLVTYDAGEHGTCATAKETWTGTALTLPTVTPEEGWSFNGWKDDENNAATSPYTPTKDVVLTAQYTALASPFDLTALTYNIGTAEAVNVGYEDGTFTYNIELPYKPSYDAITVTPTLKENSSSLKGDEVLTVSSLPGAATFTVVAAGGASEQLYTVNFKKAVKDGTSIIKAEATATSQDITGDKLTGVYKGAAHIEAASSYKFNEGKYFMVQLEEGKNFQAGDSVKINVYAVNDCNGFTLYSSNEFTAANLIIDTHDGTGAQAKVSDGVNSVELPSSYTGSNVLYVARASGADKYLNAGINQVEVVRALNPILKEVVVTIGTVEYKASPNNLNKVAIEVPYSTTLETMNIAYTWVSNSDAWTADHTPSVAADWAFGVENTVTLTDKDGDQTAYGVTISKAAASTVNTLSVLEINNVAVSEIPANGIIECGEIAYGATLPQITKATPTHAAALANISNEEVYNTEGKFYYVQVVVTPEAETPVKYYQVRYTKAPKLGTTLIKGALTSNTAATISGMVGGTYDLSISTSAEDGGYKLDNGKYFGLTLADGYFQDGDIVAIEVTKASTSGGSTMAVYSDNSALEAKLITNSGKLGAVGMNYFVLSIPGGVENLNTLYIARNDDNNPANKWNGYVKSFAVMRVMDGMIKNFSIGGVAGTINQANKTIAVEVPKGTALTALTPNVEAYANGGATVTPAGAQDFSAGAVNYTVSSAYDEDDDVVYAVTVTEGSSYKIAIFDGSEASPAIHSSPDAVTGLKWDVTGGSIESKSASKGGKEYANAYQIGSSGNSRYMKVEIPVDYVGQFYIVHASNSDDARKVFVTEGETPTQTDPANNAIYSVSNTRNSFEPGVSAVVPAGKYCVNVSGGTCNFYELSVILTPTAKTPVITADLSNLAVCALGSDALEVTVATPTDGGTLSYQWYNADGDVAIENEVSASYTPTAEGTYYVIVTNTVSGRPSSSKKSAEAAVSVKAATAITAHVDAVGAVDAEKTISVTAEGTNLTYQWQACDANGDVTDATVLGTAASLNVVIAAETKYYLATVTGACGVQTQVVEAREWHEVEPVNVTGSRVWNWTSAAFNGIDEAIAFGNTSVEELMANVSSKVPNYESFRSDMLYGTGQYVWRPDDRYFQGFKVRFVTTVPGIVKVTYRGTGNNKNIILSINDSTYAEYQGGFTTVKNFVQAGEVVIEGVGGSGNAGGMTRIQRIEFVAEDDYHRTVNPANIGTLCWTNNAVLFGATLYEFAGKNENNYLVFDEVTSNRLEAGKPYIFMPENGNTEIKVYNIDDAAALTQDQDPVNNMYGTITGKTLVPGEDDDMYYFSSNHIWAVKDFAVNISVPAYYCYVDYPAVLAAEPAPSTPAPGRRRVTMGVNGQNTATGVENLNSSEKPVKLLINGQIFILRGEKLFDATGRLVK